MRTWVIPLWLIACAEEPPQADADADCAGAAALAWENYGDGFFRSYCQGCHAGGAPERFGAPPSVTFDTEQEVVAQREAILDVVLGPRARMPPGGGVPEEDLEALALYLRCGTL